MTDIPTPQQITAMAEATGLPVAPEMANRIARAISPALTVFAGVSGTLPFEAEPANFIAAQKGQAE